MPQPTASQTIAERMLRIDFLAGFAVGIIAVAIWAQAYDLEIGEMRYFGPGFLPKVLGTGLATAACVLMVWGLLQSPAHAERIRLRLRGPVMVAVGILFFALFIRGWHVGPIPTPKLGLLVVGPFTVILAGLGSREADVRELIVLGFGLTALTTLLFADLLGMQIPIYPGFAESRINDLVGFDWSSRVAYVACFAISYGLFRHFGFDETIRAAQTGDRS